MSKPTVVFYHIINDKEDKNSQNVFYILKPIGSITLKDIKNEFPLIGTYHFRFKILHNNIPAWVDVSDESSPVPSLNSCIYAKVLRLSWLDNKTGKEITNDKNLHDQDIMKSYKNDKMIYHQGNEKNHMDEHMQESQKTKNNIDMLLFETAPNKSNQTNVNQKNDDSKDQNYFDLMFN
ncbi:conserved Plasmodium protein, unknown function [Plasmodium sp. gorilla clade G2]|uniref:conserved Plasmodium protein, unknown function n=1 Tax=Plasmodium sp. gorilla clade G2 TaxID=880535 RepID=UPI000D208405|nr:conserved Plasmodium protein, unknown function [Plasmodium sp. gorilla clade G2]SOV18932.1 conserved Plasmodium protein, unknown function [Plasmodium sp. gorilla clade G2]